MRRILGFGYCAGLLPFIAAGCGARSVRSSEQAHGGTAAVEMPSAAGAGGGKPAVEAASDAGAGGASTLPLACEDRALSDVESGHDLVPGYAAPRDPRVEAWVAALGTDQRIVEMQADQPPGVFNYQDIERSLDLPLGDGSVIRGYLYRYGTRGVNLDDGQPLNRDQSDGRNYSTAFPAESVRGAAFDLELEWEIGEAIGDETMVSLNTLLRGPGVNLVRHPYWGGAQDAYGEDAYHSGRLGSAFAAGVQTHVAACVMRWAAYNVEHPRSDVNAVVDEQTLREIYGRPFEMVVRDGGVACVVGAQNEVNGQKSTANAHLIRDILKADVSQGGFGFRGFVSTDLFAAPGDQGELADSDNENVAVTMANAGLDVELPFTLRYHSLSQAVADGRVAPSVITDAAARVLEQKARFGSALSTDPYGLGTAGSTLAGSSIVTNPAHLALAERAELESAVLLQNGRPGAPALPIPSGAGTVAVIGAEVPFSLVLSTVPKSCVFDGIDPRTCTFHFATDVALGDRASNRVNADPAQSVGPFAGIGAAAARHGVANVIQGSTAADATDADFVVVVVGLTPGDEGEEFTVSTGGDRTSLDLPAEQATLVSDVLALNKPTAVVIESGSIVNVPWLSDSNTNQATIWAGYGGMRSGAALGELLFGDANFGGKLPLAWPQESELPPFTPTGFATGMSGTGHDVTMGYFFGYRDYDQRQKLGQAVNLVFPFGHGLSYTTFSYSNPALPCTEVTPGAVLDVTVDVTNAGALDGDEIAFLFVEGPAGASGAEPRAVRELKSFARVHVSSGATEHVSLPLRIADLRHWSGDANGRWVLDSGTYRVLIGPRDADDALTTAGTFSIR
jgi:beta-glucosidase